MTKHHEVESNLCRLIADMNNYNGYHAYGSEMDLSMFKQLTIDNRRLGTDNYTRYFIDISKCRVIYQNQNSVVIRPNKYFRLNKNSKGWAIELVEWKENIKRLRAIAVTKRFRTRTMLLANPDKLIFSEVI